MNNLSAGVVVIIFALLITIIPAGLISYLFFLENPKISWGRLITRVIIGVLIGISITLYIGIFVSPEELVKWIYPTSFKDFLQIIQSLAAIIIIIGGLRWFFKRRKHLPRANVSQKLDYFLEPNDKLFIMIEITITNPGDVALSLDAGYIAIYQVKPYTTEVKNAIDNNKEALFKELYKYNISWKPSMVLEQTITDVFPFQFVIDAKVKDSQSQDTLLETFQAVSYFPNTYEPDYGWGITTTHKIEPLPKIEALSISNGKNQSRSVLSNLLGKFRGN